MTSVEAKPEKMFSEAVGAVPPAMALWMADSEDGVEGMAVTVICTLWWLAMYSCAIALQKASCGGLGAAQNVIETLPGEPLPFPPPPHAARTRLSKKMSAQDQISLLDFIVPSPDKVVV